MTNLPLSELEAALKKATPGEWQLCAHLQKAEDKCCGGPRGFIYAPNIKAQGLPEGDGHICLIDHDTPRLHDDCFLEGMPLPSRDRALANAALIVLLRNNADALVEAAKKWVAHEANPAVGVCTKCGTTIWRNQARIETPEHGWRHDNCVHIARAEESARKLAEAELEVERLKEELAGNVRRESAAIDQQTPPDEELRLIVQVEEEEGGASLLAIVAKRLLETRRLVRWHMAIGGEYEAAEAFLLKIKGTEGKATTEGSLRTDGVALNTEAS